MAGNSKHQMFIEQKIKAPFSLIDNEFIKTVNWKRSYKQLKICFALPHLFTISNSTVGAKNCKLKLEAWVNIRQGLIIYWTIRQICLKSYCWFGLMKHCVISTSDSSKSVKILVKITQPSTRLRKCHDMAVDGRSLCIDSFFFIRITS